MKKFKKIDDVLEFPLFRKEDDFNKAVEEYLEAGAIAKEDLIPGGWYVGQCRNTTIAQWWPNLGFEYIRHKITPYVEHIPHFQDGFKEEYDVFVPFKLIYKA